MRDSKKLLALALAAALTLGSATTALAAEGDKDSEGEAAPISSTAPDASASDAKKDTASTDGEDGKDNTAPADSEDGKDNAAPADSEDGKDNTAPADSEDGKDTAPADSEDGKDNTAPADSEDGKDNAAPADSEDGKDTAPADSEDGKDTAPAAMAYTDVTSKNWYHDAVAFVTGKNLIDGLTDTTFGPGEKMTRQMLAVALYRLAGSPAVTVENPFTDVADSAAYKDAVLWAYSAGVVNGVNNTTFSPDSTIERQAIAAMLARYLHVDAAGESDLSSFTDAGEIRAYAKDALSWAVTNGLVQGNPDGSINPRGEATRAQVAAILQRFVPMAEDSAEPGTPAPDTDTPAAGTDQKEDGTSDPGTPAPDTDTPAAGADKKEDGTSDPGTPAPDTDTPAAGTDQKEDGTSDPDTPAPDTDTPAAGADEKEDGTSKPDTPAPAGDAASGGTDKE